jgi:hypothetical protein
MKQIIIILLLNSVILIVESQNRIQQEDSINSELILLKNQVFCDCYFEATKNAKTKIFPPDGSNYLQISNLVQKYYLDKRIIQLIKKWMKKEYRSYVENNQLYLMRCLDLYNSKELEIIMRQIKAEELNKTNHSSSETKGRKK